MIFQHFLQSRDRTGQDGVRRGCNYSLISTGHRSSGDHARGARELGWFVLEPGCVESVKEGGGKRRVVIIIMVSVDLDHILIDNSSYTT